MIGELGTGGLTRAGDFLWWRTNGDGLERRKKLLRSRDVSEDTAQGVVRTHSVYVRDIECERPETSREIG